MFTTDTIREALGTVLDPELRIDVISLGLVYEVRIDNEKDIYVKLTLTTPGCPLIDFFLLDINKKLKSLEGVGEVKVDLTFDPPWTPDKMSAEAKAALGIE
ncbi:MAG: metal-sulfur cluster assembly factor [Patescibacteria group bacterium]